jgi:hypothetical protein
MVAFLLVLVSPIIAQDEPQLMVHLGCKQLNDGSWKFFTLSWLEKDGTIKLVPADIFYRTSGEDPWTRATKSLKNPNRSTFKLGEYPDSVEIKGRYNGVKGKSLITGVNLEVTCGTFVPPAQ